MFISSGGGHLSEMLMLESLFPKYDYHIITEKTKTTRYLKDKYKNKVNYMVYGTKDHMLTYPFKLLINCFKTVYYYFKIRPDFIVTTGAHTAGPMCILGHMFGSKVIFIETFANRKTKTSTGKLLYPIADSFVVQWEEMKDVYPDSTYIGPIF